MKFEIIRWLVCWASAGFTGAGAGIQVVLCGGLKNFLSLMLPYLLLLLFLAFLVFVLSECIDLIHLDDKKLAGVNNITILSVKGKIIFVLKFSFKLLVLLLIIYFSHIIISEFWYVIFLWYNENYSNRILHYFIFNLILLIDFYLPKGWKSIKAKFFPYLLKDILLLDLWLVFCVEYL